MLNTSDSLSVAFLYVFFVLLCLPGPCRLLPPVVRRVARCLLPQMVQRTTVLRPLFLQYVYSALQQAQVSVPVQKTSGSICVQ